MFVVKTAARPVLSDDFWESLQHAVTVPRIPGQSRRSNFADEISTILVGRFDARQGLFSGHGAKKRLQYNSTITVLCFFGYMPNVVTQGKDVSPVRGRLRHPFLELGLPLAEPILFGQSHLDPASRIKRSISSNERLARGY